MTQREALLRAVLVNPADDLPRMVYADWLEERGQPERADFIRVQIELERREWRYDPEVGHTCDLDGCEICSDGHDYKRLKKRERKGFKKNRYDLFESPFADDPGSYIVWQHGDPLIEWDWSRGFVSEVRLHSAMWARFGSLLVSNHPVQVVALTDLIPKHYHRVSFEVWGWRSTNVGRPFDIPHPVWSMMAEMFPSIVFGAWRDFTSEGEAFLALSLSALNVERRKLGLPLLTVATSPSDYPQADFRPLMPADGVPT